MCFAYDLPLASIQLKPCTMGVACHVSIPVCWKKVLGSFVPLSEVNAHTNFISYTSDTSYALSIQHISQAAHWNPLPIRNGFTVKFQWLQRVHWTIQGHSHGFFAQIETSSGYMKIVSPMNKRVSIFTPWFLTTRFLNTFCGAPFSWSFSFLNFIRLPVKQRGWSIHPRKPFGMG